MELRWDLFCRVIDNYGDIGVCWRLARALAERGQQVRLWLDDASALAWMAPSGRPAGIEVLPWSDAEQETTGGDEVSGPLAAEQAAGDVVIEAFGCELPEAFVRRMAARAVAPRWINLEYLSAESYVERSHGLHSPQFRGPGAGLDKQFFYPGFTTRTGGLLRERGLLQAHRDFDAPAWLAQHGIVRRNGERLVSLFAYANPALPDLLHALADRPTLVLVCPGAAQQAVGALRLPPTVRWQSLPYLDQDTYDRLLWTCDWNFVRGEDSFVRAQWAGQAMVWQIYPQQDAAHAPKLEAFMDRWLAQAEPGVAEELRRLWRGWNGLQPWSSDRLPPTAAAGDVACRWRAQLLEQADLVTQLLLLASKTG